MKGHITKEQLSDNLKEYLQTLGLTEEQVVELITRISGDMSLLQTNNKTNLVEAINEIKGISNEAFQSGVNVKNNMVQAINSKITVPDINTDDTWDTILNSVNNIKEAQGTAVATDVLSGKTFTNANGGLITGTMANRGGAVTVTPTTVNQTKSAGYYSGNITIKGDVNLIASNILSGKSIFGVSGSVIAGKRWATGSAQCDAGAKQTTISKVTSGIINVYPLTLSLSFTPSIVIAITGDYITCLRNGYFYIAQCASTSSSSTGTTARCSVNTTFTSTVIPVVLSGVTYSWIAIE